LEDVRSSKLRGGALAVAGQTAIKLNSVAALEINVIRSLLCDSLNQFYQLSGNNEVSSPTSWQPPPTVGATASASSEQASEESVYNATTVPLRRGGRQYT